MTLYVEAVRATDAPQQIVVKLDPDGDGPAGFELSDAVRVTVASERLDVDVDSDNNDGLALPGRTQYEDAIEEDSTKPGKYVNINLTDADLDGVPDFADGFQFTGADGAHDASPLVQFVPIVVALPLDMDVDAATLTFDYMGSDPLGIGILANPDTTTGAVPFLYSPATDQQGNPGQLRLWSRDGSVFRNPAGIAAGGDYITPGAAISASQLGFSATRRTITLYIEAVGTDADHYGTVQPIHVTLAGTSTTPAVSDTVNVTCVYNAGGWRALTDQQSGFNRRVWNPNLGFQFNERNIRRIYSFYDTQYTRDYQQNGNGATLGKFQWMGLATVAGGSVLYGFEQMEDAATYAQSYQTWYSALQPLSWLGAPVPDAGNVATHIQEVEVQWMRIANDIYNDLAWQHVAYNIGGIDEIHRLGAADQIPGSGAQVNVVAAWDMINTGTPQGIWDRNLALIDEEQNVVAAVGYAILRGMMMVDPTDDLPAGVTVPSVDRRLANARTVSGWVNVRGLVDR